MDLKKKTNAGTLMVRYKADRMNAPGFWVDLFRKGKSLLPVCTVEYEPIKDCVQVAVFADGNSKEPTHIIPINLPEEEDCSINSEENIKRDAINDILSRIMSGLEFTESYTDASWYIYRSDTSLEDDLEELRNAISKHIKK